MTATSDSIAIQLTSAATGTVNAIIKNDEGSVITTIALTDRGDNFHSEEDITGLSEGYYYVTFKDDTGVIGDGVLIWDGTNEVLPGVSDAVDIINELLTANLIELKGSNYIFTTPALQKAPLSGSTHHPGGRLHEEWTTKEKDAIKKALGVNDSFDVNEKLNLMKAKIDVLDYSPVTKKLQDIETTMSSLLSYPTASNTTVEHVEHKVDFTGLENDLLEVKQLISGIRIPEIDNSGLMDQLSTLVTVVNSLDFSVDFDILLDKTIAQKVSSGLTTVLTIRELLEQIYTNK